MAAELYRPAAQSAQLEAWELANLPATQWSQSKSLPALNRPGAQGLHPEEPAALK